MVVDSWLLFTLRQVLIELSRHHKNVTIKVLHNKTQSPSNYKSSILNISAHAQ